MLYENELGITLERFLFLMSHPASDYKNASKELLVSYKEEYTSLLNHFYEVYDLLEHAKTRAQQKGLYTPNFIFSVKGKCSSHLDQIIRRLKDISVS